LSRGHGKECWRWADTYAKNETSHESAQGYAGPSVPGPMAVHITILVCFVTDARRFGIRHTFRGGIQAGELA
jgi:hypothetical protein